MKLPLYEDTPRLSTFIDNLVLEMKRGAWTYSDEHYARAKEYFLDEQLDADPEQPPSKGMLAVMFYSTLSHVWDEDAREICEQSSQFVILNGDVRKLFTMSAPMNEHGFTSLLISPDHQILAALTAEGAKGFHEHIRNLNARRI